MKTRAEAAIHVIDANIATDADHAFLTLVDHEGQAVDFLSRIIFLWPIQSHSQAGTTSSEAFDEEANGLFRGLGQDFV